MTDKYGPKISAVTFYRHRFKKALQILNSTNGDPLEAYAKLKQQLNASNKKIGGSAILFIVLSSALIASMPEGSLKIKTAFASFSVPTVYLLFGASVIWFTLCMSLLSTCQILTFLSTFRQFFGRYKNDYEMLVFLKGVEIDDFTAPPMFDTFLKPSRFMVRARSIIFSVIIIAILIPVLTSLISISKIAFTIYGSYQIAPLSNSLVVGSGALLAFSTLYIITAFVPFSTLQQRGLVRWMFLLKVHERHSQHPHPRVSQWLRQDKEG